MCWFVWKHSDNSSGDLLICVSCFLGHFGVVADVVGLLFFKKWRETSEDKSQPFKTLTCDHNSVDLQPLSHLYPQKNKNTSNKNNIIIHHHSSSSSSSSSSNQKNPTKNIIQTKTSLFVALCFRPHWVEAQCVRFGPLTGLVGQPKYLCP